MRFCVCSRQLASRYARRMFSFLPGIPGTDDLRALARKVDTARHRGVPDGCVLELDLLSVPNETGGFDPFAMIASGGKPLLLREAVAAIHRAAEGRPGGRPYRPRSDSRRRCGSGARNT